MVDDDRDPQPVAAGGAVRRRAFTRIRGWGCREWCLASLLLVVVLALAVKGADLAIGAMGDGQIRHVFQLDPSASLRVEKIRPRVGGTLNAQGFRGPAHLEDKPPGTLRVAILGSSYIALTGLPNEDSFPRQVERWLNEMPAPRFDEAEVINLGKVDTQRASPADLYAAFGRQFQPDVVVLCVALADCLSDATHELPPDILARWHPPGLISRLTYACYPNLYLNWKIFSSRQQSVFRPPAQHSRSQTEEQILAQLQALAVQRGVTPEAAVARYETLPIRLQRGVRRGRIESGPVFEACLDPQRFVRILEPDPKMFDAAWPSLTQQMERVREEVEQDHAELIVVIIPLGCQTNEERWLFDEDLGYEVRGEWLTQTTPVQQAILDWTSQQGVPCLDLTPAFRDLTESVYKRWDLELNSAGHAHTAQLISQYVRNLFVDDAE